MKDNKTVLAFFAHPDDAEFLCAGTLIRLADAGWEIHIATASAGDCGTMTESPQAISAIRTDEGRRAAAMIKAEYHCMDERDLMIVFDKPTLRKTLDLFRKIAPGLVFTHALKDYMMDHEMVSMLARAATFGYGAPNASMLPRKDRSMVPWLYYCDPPEGRDPMGQLVTPTTTIDITQQIERKADMLACHASQRQWLRAHHGMDEYLDSMRRLGAMRGEAIGVAAGEAFVQHLGHPYPHNDLLAEIFGK